MIFNIGIAVIFILAVIHTFMTPHLHVWASQLRMRQIERPYRWRFYYFLSEFVQLCSEIEVVFGLWLVPLFLWASAFTSWQGIKDYVITRDYTFALYIMVIVVVVGSRPIISFAERVLEFFARIGKDSAGAWWLAIMSIGPLLGSILKEPGAMALSAILLSKKFYPYQPSRSFQYATLGLLFANISVGGLLSPYSSRALFFAAKTWEWDTHFMFTNFGWKLLIAMAAVNLIYYFIFRQNFVRHFPKKLPLLEKGEERKPTPFWITLIHLVFVIAISTFSLHAPIFFGLFIAFLGFHQVTRFYQSKLHLKQSALVGFFFASLILHGELQGFWLLPLLQDYGERVMAASSFILSAFADNAIVNYLGTQLTDLSARGQYILVASTMAAGGMTAIANVANPLGLTILRHSFHE
ncbi:MAG: putative Na+/H+ antiporter, partial [Chlamydiae bacterium]|nr:putative Na+/H+ antiporter [Chlamydiota bacterium]